ncbi:polysaccharide pyruvyl transferase family protein [Halorhodospira halophila]|uniref:polysaccharide pyruvyl transferase family protein n=1 Tax=Halorhodospira halophila TaxID=1053 RepID=UPI00191281F9|nr:polysaccharide pyruvyl transferase family protein [Halorhodospira halophila]MBK5943627.1 hypothetical protein [Halorhodospira halophila]
MKHVAFVTAYPVHGNHGMLSVNIAARDIINRIAPEWTCTYFCIETDYSLCFPHFGGFHYEQLVAPESQLKNYDIVFFWGDFLQCETYLLDVANRLQKREQTTYQKALDRCFKCLLFENTSPELLQKTVLFGGSTFPNAGYKAPKSDRYKNAARNLLASSLLVMPRDVFTYDYFASLVPYRAKNGDLTPSLDPAFFLDSNLACSQPPKKDHILIALSRSFASKGFVLKRKHANSSRIINYLSNVFQLPTRKSGWRTNPWNVEHFEHTLAELQDAKFVITDTYHCAINSWLRGTPAVLLTERHASFSSPTSSLKLILLANSINATPFLLTLSRKAKTNIEAAHAIHLALKTDAPYDTLDTIIAKKDHAIEKLYNVCVNK